MYTAYVLEMFLYIIVYCFSIFFSYSFEASRRTFLLEDPSVAGAVEIPLLLHALPRPPGLPAGHHKTDDPGQGTYSAS